MTTHLAVCGDSFSVGHGLEPEVQFEHSFGGLVASHYGLKHLVYGRSGCCNFVIYLQIKKIIDQTRLNPFYKPFVLVTSTWYDRVTFPLSHSIFKLKLFSDPDLSQVDYLNYEPYRKSSPVPRKLAFKTNKTQRLLSETLPGLNHLHSKINPEDKDAVDLYVAHLYDPAIKEIIDNSLLTSAHRLLVKHKIPHLFISPSRISTIESQNNLIKDWRDIICKHPDQFGTGHCNEQGHKIMSENVIKHFSESNIKIG